ncbi:MAG: DUF1801 domain-containing protein [Flavobacteriaceae bacterium]|nr:DUF1801 domain-containing protein [Flavobacteriaceae bacterium]
MSENKTKPTQEDVHDFIQNSDPKKIQDSLFLVDLMERLTGEKACMWGPSIIGFGQYHYTYASGREGDMPLIGFSPRKAKFSLYVHHYDSAEQLKLIEKLGKLQVSKGCIYINELDDINLDILEELIKMSIAETKKKYSN